ncbi:hypothetical protein PSJE_29405 [Pseudomonas jessenii]|uniref:Uncharacterized protein n=2 Tax=Pseudomonas TaxID=286 RepID=A0A231FXB5_PSEJE|nr:MULTISPECIES: hypothetical protein [Pseudomonas]OXR28862.1 hypothetical protein PSJE_29405 [Pseudomonas jessenii]SEB31428.1 hypothetical protein SAMN04490187_0204 [Pseudomonas jessenii]VVQ12420.1 hypothetical protein PS922_04957 [Pseudomonas fluorescens]
MKNFTGAERALWELCFSRIMVNYVSAQSPQGEVQFAADSAANAANALILVRRSGLNGDRDNYEQRLWDSYVGDAMIKFSTEVHWKLEDYVVIAGRVAKNADSAVAKYRGTEGSELPSFPFGS